ncbi:MAG: PIN domain-containing protein [Anaerolineae bacterium]
MLLDTNVVLDFLLDREPFAEAATEIWEANRQGRIEAYVSAITPVNIFYIARKLRGVEVARQIVEGLLNECRIAMVDRAVLQDAMMFSLKDYEDAVQLASAMRSRLDAIVTRNPKDYPSAPLLVLSPSDLVTILTPENSGNS